MHSQFYAAKSFGHFGQNQIIAMCHDCRPSTYSILIINGRIVSKQSFRFAQRSNSISELQLFGNQYCLEFIILRVSFEVKIKTPIKKVCVKRLQTYQTNKIL